LVSASTKANKTFRYLENRYADTVVLTFAEIEDLLVIDGPFFGPALGRHHREATRLLQPPRERLLTETGLERQLSGADRIVPGQPFEHFLFVGHGEWSGHVVVAFSPLASKS
jgi:hypothetical protein